MGVDASIAMGVRTPQLESPMNALAKMMEVQQAQQSNQLNGMKMDEYTRGVGENNKLNALYSGALRPDGTLDRTKVISGAAAGGLGSKIPGLQKSWSEQDEATGKVDAQKFKLASERHTLYQKEMGALSQNPNLTREMALQVGQSLVQQGILPAEMFEKSAANLPDDPVQLRKMLLQGLQSQLTPEQIFTVFAPKAEKLDNGGSISFRDMNPNSPTYGQATGGAAVRKEQSPDSIASNVTSRANNAASVGASYANANATRAVAASNVEAARMRRDQDTEMKLGDDYRAQSKDFKAVGDAYKQINATLDKSTTSPAATLAAATKFMKLLDPGSVVRESELGMALAATGVFDRATNYVNTLKYGKVLTPSQAADFKNITAQIYGAAQAGQQSIDKDYTSKAKAYKLRPENIVQDLGQNTPATTKPTAPALPDGWTVKVN